MSALKKIRDTLFFLTFLLLIQGYSQNNLTLQDTIIFSEATFTSYSSINVGPNLLVAATGDLTLNTHESVFFKPGLTIVGGGQFQAINDQTIVNAIESEVLEIPDKFSVQQNYPNPFNPTTLISYTLPSSEDVSIIVYNSLGQEVRNLISASQQAGAHTITWDGRSNTGQAVSNGTYYYLVKAGKFRSIKKMILLK